MKAYFTRLFEYDWYANNLMLQAIEQADNVEKPVQLMAHLLTAQQIWLNRCKELPVTGGALWPDWPASSLSEINKTNNTLWLNFLDGLTTPDFDFQVKYKNFKSESCSNNLADILTHVINHGTHHRAQAGQHLKATGVEQLPVTDYIFYIRSLNANV